VWAADGHFEDPYTFENSVKVPESWSNAQIKVTEVMSETNDNEPKQLSSEMPQYDLIGKDYEPINDFVYVPLWNAWNFPTDCRLRNIKVVDQPGNQISGRDFSRHDGKPMKTITVSFTVSGIPNQKETNYEKSIDF
jgi:hypothetical protein